MGDVYCIRPYDKSTDFLDRVVNHIIDKTSCDTIKWNIPPIKEEHQKRLGQISNLKNNELVIFLGHGRTDLLFGAKGKYADSFSVDSNEAIKENPEEYFQRDTFIDESNISCLAKNKLIVIACNFGKKKGLGSRSISYGLTSVLAFGEIPTSPDEFKDRLKYDSVPEKIVARYKGEISHILKHSITYALNNEFTFYELKKLIKYVTNKRALNILVGEKELGRKDLLIDALYLFRSQIYLYGDINQRLI